MHVEGDALAACRDRALLLLGQRAHSAGELMVKLLRKGFPRQVNEEVIRDLNRVGLVDDAAFAAAFCEERLRGSRPLGRMRLQAELRRRQVDSAIATHAIEEAFGKGGEDLEYDVALRAGRGKWRSLTRSAGRDPAKARDSLYRFLAGRGFAGNICRRVVDSLQAGTEHSDENREFWSV